MTLSSKGESDFWYLLDDDSGTIVLRSKEEIKSESCKIDGEVKKTGLGQVYVEVRSCK